MIGVERRNILGCPFDAISFDATVAAIEEAVIQKERLTIVPGSIDTVMKARRDPKFAADLRTADLVVADGVPIVWSATLLGTPLKRRVSGTELVWMSAAVSARTKCPVALIGAREGVAARAAVKMQQRFPEAVLHALSTPWPPNEKQSLEIAQRIRDLDVGIVLAALGAPRQERWINTYLEATGAFVGIGIGSAFDIISGDQPRAPQWMQDYGLEWFHRMLLEPKRLGKRYLIEDTPFIFHLLREVISRRFSSQGSEA